MKFKSILVLLFLPALLSAQGKYIKSENNGVCLSGGYVKDDFSGAFNLKLGYSFHGFTDIGLAYSRISLDDASSLVGNFYGLNLNLHLFKQRPALPISFLVSTSYSLGGYSSEFLEHNNPEIQASAFSFGGTIYGVLSQGHQIEIMPELGLGYTMASAQIVNSNASVDKSAASMYMSISLIFFESDRNLFVVTPGITGAEGNIAYWIEVNIVRILD